MVMMGLRLRDGVHLDAINALCGPVESWIDFTAINQCVDSGWLCYDHETSNLFATPDGRLRLDNILTTILR